MAHVDESHQHRHQWEDFTRAEDAGTRWKCAGCGTSYFEPFLPRDADQPPVSDLYYLKEG